MRLISYTHCEAVVHTSMTIITLLSPVAAAFMGGSAYPILSRTSRSALEPLYLMSLPLMGGPNSKVPPGCRSESDKCSDDGVGDRGGVGEASNSPDGADIGEPSDSADGILSECDGDDDLVRSGLLEKESRPLIVLRIDSNRRFESDECSDDGLEDGGAASGEASDSPDGADIGELSNSPNGIPSERNGDDDLERVLLLVEKES